MLEELRKITERRDAPWSFPLSMFDVLHYMQARAMKGKYTCRFGKVALSEETIKTLKEQGFKFIKLKTEDNDEVKISWRPEGQ